VTVVDRRREVHDDDARSRLIFTGLGCIGEDEAGGRL
jgi:hypothetical protein